MILICDVNEYRECVRVTKMDVIIKMFDQLLSLCNLLVAPPANLGSLCDSIYGVLEQKEPIAAFVRLRADYRTAGDFVRSYLWLKSKLTLLGASNGKGFGTEHTVKGSTQDCADPAVVVTQSGRARVGPGIEVPDTMTYKPGRSQASRAGSKARARPGPLKMQKIDFFKLTNCKLFVLQTDFCSASQLCTLYRMYQDQKGFHLKNQTFHRFGKIDQQGLERRSKIHHVIDNAL